MWSNSIEALSVSLDWVSEVHLKPSTGSYNIGREMTVDKCLKVFDGHVLHWYLIRYLNCRIIIFYVFMQWFGTSLFGGDLLVLIIRVVLKYCYRSFLFLWKWFASYLSVPIKINYNFLSYASSIGLYIIWKIPIMGFSPPLLGGNLFINTRWIIIWILEI